jgi:hypothetical protein
MLILEIYAILLNNKTFFCLKTILSMKHSNFNRTIFVYFLLINQTSIFGMQHNASTKEFHKRNISPKIIKKTVVNEKIVIKEKRSDLTERLKCRFLKELVPMFTKEPIQSAPATYIDLLPEVPATVFNEDALMTCNYPIHDNCFLEWTEK